MDAAQEKSEAILKLERIGASFGYKDESKDVHGDSTSDSVSGSRTGAGLVDKYTFPKPDLVLIDGFSGAIDEVVPLGDLNTLECVAIVDSRVGDEVLAILLKLPALEDLNLHGTDISDHGLMQLIEMPQLRNIVVTNTSVTVSGAAKFRIARPDCKLFSEDVDGDWDFDDPYAIVAAVNGFVCERCGNSLALTPPMAESGGVEQQFDAWKVFGRQAKVQGWIVMDNRDDSYKVYCPKCRP